MLRPDIQWKNPVMFVVEVGTVLTIIYTVARVLRLQQPCRRGLSAGPVFWLVMTLLFANFASSIAEARGKAQADALRKTRQDTPAKRLKSFQEAQVVLYGARPIRPMAGTTVSPKSPCPRSFARGIMSSSKPAT